MLARATHWQLSTELGDIDLLHDAPGAAPFDELRSRSLVIALGASEIPIAGRDDLISMKRAAAGRSTWKTSLHSRRQNTKAANGRRHPRRTPSDGAVGARPTALPRGERGPRARTHSVRCDTTPDLIRAGHGICSFRNVPTKVGMLRSERRPMARTSQRTRIAGFPRVWPDISRARKGDPDDYARVPAQWTSGQPPKAFQDLIGSGNERPGETGPLRIAGAGFEPATFGL